KNSAAIAALELYWTGARVTLIHRGPKISDSVKYWIKPNIENRIKNREIVAYFESQVVRIAQDSIQVATPAGELTLANDFAVAVLAMAHFLFYQDIRTATLVGTVTDGSGAVIPNVVVTVTNVDTQVVTRSLTKGEGSYYLPFLNVGNYRLTAEAPGFKKYEQ